MDHYARLGVDRNADQDTIKKAYRKLAAKHHPDRGGDTGTFQHISAAYDILSDPQKKAHYDAELNGYGGTQFRFTSEDMGPFGQFFQAGTPFDQFFNQHMQRGSRRKNRDLNIRCKISMKQSYTGADLEATYKLPGGGEQTVLIQVPPGIDNGQVIRYNGMGDDAIPGVPRGNLNATVFVEPEEGYDRRGTDLVVFLKINPVEAMTGCEKIIRSLDDTKIRIKIPAGVQPGAEFLNRGLGFKNIHNRNVGNLIVNVVVDIPRVVDENLKKRLEELYAEINTSS